MKIARATIVNAEDDTLMSVLHCASDVCSEIRQSPSSFDDKCSFIAIYDESLLYFFSAARIKCSHHMITLCNLNLRQLSLRSH